MARSFILWFALAGALSVLRPYHLEGQTIPSSYQFFETRQEAGVFIGVTGQGTGRFGFGPGSGTTLGGRYRVHLGGPFGLEGVLGYQSATRDVVDPTRVEGDRVVGEADVQLLTADARISFSLTGERTWRGLNPFLLIGAGMAWDAAGEGEADSLVLPEDRFEFGTKFVALFGGGMRWFLSDRILLRADIALTMNRIQTPSGFLEPGRGLTRVPEREWVSGPTFSIGTAFHF